MAYICANLMQSMMKTITIIDCNFELVVFCNGNVQYFDKRLHKIVQIGNECKSYRNYCHFDYLAVVVFFLNINCLKSIKLMTAK